MFSVDNCRIIVWGFTIPANYATHSHIHEGFYRAANYLRPDSLWIDSKKQLPSDLSNTLFITNHDVAMDLPISDDCFYLIHGLNDHDKAKSKFSRFKHLSWNVYHDCSHSMALGGAGPIPGAVDKESGYFIAEDTPYYPKEKRIDFRWATDLLPAEIEAHKPKCILGQDSNVINWVGTVWWVNESELEQFKKACKEDGKEFRHLGAGQNGIISMQDNIKLVRESYMAPAISGTHHITEGYAPCRIFKNISYGQMGITNSPRVNQIFGEKLIFHTDPYRLYWLAKERLASLNISELHSLMDEVAQKHTYLNRLAAIKKAITLSLET